MALNLKPSETFRSVVQFKMLDATGKEPSQNLDVDFVRMTKDALKERQKVWAEKGFTDVEIICEIVRGWKLLDQDGNDVPFSPQAVEECCNIVPGFAYEVIETFYRGVGVARAKN